MALIELQYFSGALQKQSSAYVIHPDKNVKGPYHCMILLHGLSDDHSIWLRRTSIERYVEGLPLVVVMPDGGRGFYIDAVEGYKYFTAMAHELPDFVEHYFGKMDKWCTSGLSMGGYGALRLALGRPEKFISAVSHSGAVMFGHNNPDGKSDDPFAKEMLRITGMVDKPGGPNDLIALAKKAKPLPAIKFDCGVEDFLLPANRMFKELLVKEGIPHHYDEFPGSHTWEYWDTHIQEAIAFHRRSLEF